MWSLAIVGGLVLLVCALSARLERPDSKRRAPPMFVRASLFGTVLWAPYSWLLLIDYPMNDYRMLWIELWPVLPGLPAFAFARSLGADDETLAFVAAGAMAIVLFGGLLVLSGRGRWWFIASLTLAVLYGGAMAPMSYALFAM